MPAVSTPPSDHEVLDAHIARFENWFVAQQKAHGMEGTPLIQVEHAILRAYITWLKKHAGDQTK